jgi:hypothetical protein
MKEATELDRQLRAQWDEMKAALQMTDDVELEVGCGGWI